MSDRPDLKWGVERRLEFIEFRLFWEGGVNRSDIIEKFDVSVPQASKDLSLYQERAPGNIDYDKSAKRYVASANFTPKFLDPDPDSYLSRLRSLGEGLVASSESWIGSLPPLDVAPTPRRAVESPVLQAVLKAVRTGQSLEVLYQSMNAERADPIWRRMTPHAFGYDGFRWHARGFCHFDRKFKDFLLPRILGCREFAAPGLDGAEDKFWNEIVNVKIGPHPGLTKSQKAVVSKDYSMDNGMIDVRVRHAMLFYFLKRLNLLGDAASESSRTQHIVVINYSEVHAALQLAGLTA